mmetsp:Transcript_60005/g.71421  ORF Transcript_60005/g.71421 Transcript_60005/m.71421 type:complete len:138 (+) Transcript_60005:72-485(+)
MIMPQHMIETQHKIDNAAQKVLKKIRDQQKSVYTHTPSHSRATPSHFSIRYQTLANSVTVLQLPTIHFLIIFRPGGKFILQFTGIVNDKIVGHSLFYVDSSDNDDKDEVNDNNKIATKKTAGRDKDNGEKSNLDAKG